MSWCSIAGGRIRRQQNQRQRGRLQDPVGGQLLRHRGDVAVAEPDDGNRGDAAA